MNPQSNEIDELEQQLLGDKSFQHILKFAPESQRELMTLELAKWIDQYVTAKQTEALERHYPAKLTSGKRVGNYLILEQTRANKAGNEEV